MRRRPPLGRNDSRQIMNWAANADVDAPPTGRQLLEAERRRPAGSRSTTLVRSLASMRGWARSSCGEHDDVLIAERQAHFAIDVEEAVGTSRQWGRTRHAPGPGLQ